MQVLGLALDLVVGGDVLRRLRHGVDAVLFLHQLVDEAPADGGVVHGVVAAEGALGLGHDEGRAAHAFHAAGDHEAGFAGRDGACRGAHGVQAGAAQAVDGGARSSSGRPASSADMRATLRLSSPAWLAQP
jgi:hypothetical protein